MRVFSFFLLLAGLARVGAAAETQEGARFFEEKIRPILADRCFKCHSHGAEKIKGGLVLDSRAGALAGGETGAAVVPGEPGRSLLLEAVAHTNKDLQMPPRKGGGEKLSAAQVALLTEWVKMGAPYAADAGRNPVVRPQGAITDADRRWWAFQPPGKVAPPARPAGGWSANEIDAFVFQKLEAAGLRPAPRATPEQLVRRLYYDATGLPPTPAQTAEFVRASAANPQAATEALVDRLLASPRHGEHAARHWLDLVRYAESDGFKIDEYRPHAWRYRDYVIAAFNSDKPYARFVQEQLAGDELFPGEVDALAATGFLRLGIYEYNSRDAAGQWANMLNDITDVTADVFLGLSVQCARCHDHKFDPILQKDYYRWQAFFAPLLIPEETRVATPELTARRAAQLPIWEEKTAAIRQQIADLEEPAKEKGAREILAKFPPETRAIFDKHPDDRSPWETQIADLAFRQALYAWRYLPFLMKPAQRDQLAALQKQLAAFARDEPPELPVIPSVSDVGPVAPPTFIPKKRALGEIAPGFPSVLHPEPAVIRPLPPESTGRRAALARWLTEPGNPLTARLIVNRIWQQHFGRGLAASANDFGHLGERPTHPELLDWLAARFLADGGSLKKLHRRILVSATYQQSATPARATAERARTADPENRLLWHARTRRLTAEQIRDSMLAVSGELDLATGGPGVEASAPRRSIYTKVLRNTRDPLLEVFDLPEAFGSVPTRDTTTTSTQALQMLNSPASLQRAAAFARHLRRRPDTEEKEHVAEAYRLAFGRAPGGAELKSALAFLAQQAAAVESNPAQAKPVPFHTEKMPYRDGRAAVVTPGFPAFPLTVPDRPAFPANDFTIEGFILLKAIDAKQEQPVPQPVTIASKGVSWFRERNPQPPGEKAGASAGGWTFAVAGGELSLRLKGEPKPKGDPTGEDIPSGLRIASGKPYFVAVSVRLADTTAEGVTFYAKDLSNDDQPMQVAQVPHTITSGIRSQLPLRLGALAKGTGAAFRAILDDIRLSNTALPAEQLLLNHPALGEPTVGYWKFERDPGEYRDSSPHHADIALPVIQPPATDPKTAALTDFCHVLLNSNEFLYLD
jgi:hypothetical protein